MKTLRDLLSPREFQVAGLVRDGFSNREIASQLKISVETIKKYLYKINNKAGTDNRTLIAVRFERENHEYEAGECCILESARQANGS